MMKLPFTKMHGLGNDFVVLNFVNNPLSLTDSQFAQIANRRFGVGCDQILIVEKTDNTDIDFRYRIVNADGSEVGQCGNGARCLVKFVRQQGLTDKSSVRVATSTSVMELKANENGSVTVDMGKVSFTPETIPFVIVDSDNVNDDAKKDLYTINLEKETVEVAVANIGNPHCLLLVDDIDTAAVERIGSELESHQRFPDKVNVSFMQMVNPNEVKLRVYERGAGETLACGSGACAAVAIGQQLGLLCEDVTVHLPGGALQIFRKEQGNVMMTGAAEFSFTGEMTF